jgi:hypothetical protein
MAIQQTWALYLPQTSLSFFLKQGSVFTSNKAQFLPQTRGTRGTSRCAK